MNFIFSHNDDINNFRDFNIWGIKYLDSVCKRLQSKGGILQQTSK